MAKRELDGIDELRAAVRLFDSCREDFNARYTAEELLKIYRANQQTGWDIYPDEWEERQVREAIRGKVPEWGEDPSGEREARAVYKGPVLLRKPRGSGYTVHNPDGQKLASLKYSEDAAALVATLADGSTIRRGRQVLWTEGKEEYPAAESYDGVAQLMAERMYRKPS